MLNENAAQINFDDKSYEELLREATEQLPLLNQSWTDYNAHDPGVTILELLTWLTESQRYYVNQITQKHKLKYLKLLGITPRLAEPARLPVIFSPADAVIKKGAQTVISGIPFTLDKETVLTDTKIGLLREIGGEASGAYGFMPFGENPQEGDCFYISFDKQPSKHICFYVKILPPKGFNRMRTENGYYQLAALRFDIKSGGEWLACEVIDKTCGFMQSGEVLIDMPQEGTLLRCVLTGCEIDIPPMLEQLYPHYAELIQYNEVYGGADNTVLSERGNITASFRQCPDGWIKTSARDAVFTVFADEPYRAGEYVVEDNKINLNTAPLFILQENFSLLVREEDGVYREWSRVQDLSCSPQSARHYVLDGTNGIIYFGDNIHGRQAGSAVITSMRLTQGSGGGVKEGHEFNINGVNARNPFPSYSGNNPETPEEAFSRNNSERLKAYRAVTSDDYRELVLQTPGLCIENINVYSDEPGRVNICVKAPFGRLTDSYIRNIRRKIYERRLPCTEIRIIPPVLWEGIYYIRILPQAWAIDKRNEIKEFVDGYFRGLENIFRLTISLAAWIKELERSPFIKKIEELSLKRRNGETVSPHGEITLPPDGLLRIINKEITIG